MIENGLKVSIVWKLQIAALCNNAVFLAFYCLHEERTTIAITVMMVLLASLHSEGLDEARLFTLRLFHTCLLITENFCDYISTE